MWHEISRQEVCEVARMGLSAHVLPRGLQVIGFDPLNLFRFLVENGVDVLCGYCSSSVCLRMVFTEMRI